MARKSNKTSHILNLLSGDGAPGEEPEKDSSQNPDFSGGNKDTATTDIPTISIVDHFSNDDDPISNLIKENLESQVSLPPEKEPETKVEEETSAVEYSSSSYEELPVDTAEGESNELAATMEQDEGIRQDYTKEPVQQSVTQEPSGGNNRNEGASHTPSSGEDPNRTMQQDTTPVERNTPSDVIQDPVSTSHTPSSYGQEHPQTPHTVPINGQDSSKALHTPSAGEQKDTKTQNSHPKDVPVEPDTLDSASSKEHSESQNFDSSPTASRNEVKASNSTSTGVHDNSNALNSSVDMRENQPDPNPPSGNQQNKALASQVSEQKSEEIKKVDKQQLATAPKPKKSLHYVNVMEHIVTERIVSFMENFQMCTCDRCVTDATALTLTLLPAKYIVVDSYAESPLLNYYSNKFISQVTVEITKACNIVKNNPHH